MEVKAHRCKFPSLFLKNDVTVQAAALLAFPASCLSVACQYVACLGLFSSCGQRARGLCETKWSLLTMAESRMKQWGRLVIKWCQLTIQGAPHTGVSTHNIKHWEMI